MKGGTDGHELRALSAMPLSAHRLTIDQCRVGVFKPYPLAHR